MLILYKIKKKAKNNIYVLKLQNISEEIIKKSNLAVSSIVNIKRTEKWVCPFVLAKNIYWKNLFLELFSFLDQYYIKLVKNYFTFKSI